MVVNTYILDYVSPPTAYRFQNHNTINNNGHNRNVYREDDAEDDGDKQKTTTPTTRSFLPPSINAFLEWTITSEDHGDQMGQVWNDHHDSAAAISWARSNHQNAPQPEPLARDDDDSDNETEEDEEEEEDSLWLSRMEQLRQTELMNGIQRLYYINLDKNIARREQMESHLIQVKPPLPYQRFAALRATATPSLCRPRLQDTAYCAGVAGLVQSVLTLMGTENMTGISLVLEDDFIIGHNLTIIQEAIDLVPPDWDIIRLLGKPKFPSPKAQAEAAIMANQVPNAWGWELYHSAGRDVPCGGTHAMVWRYSSLPKLHRVWSRQPYDHIDCRIRDTSLISYVLGRVGDPRYSSLGKLQPPELERSDIPNPEAATRNIRNTKDPKEAVAAVITIKG